MRFDSLDDWLAWQETLNPAEIDLGLERVTQVMKQAGLATRFNCPLITVAGTNGKGSIVAMLEAMAGAAGLRVCSYTSPHLLRYNERIHIHQQAINDAALCEAFVFIDRQRGAVPLTYFEFGTLAALYLFSRTQADLIILEVGLGGRLDAVNVMQPSVAIISSIGIDHTAWLGNSREQILREKAGIFRAQTPAICGDRQPPASLFSLTRQLGADLNLLGRDYDFFRHDNDWDFHGPYGDVMHLPIPALKGEFQLNNAATAILALQCLQFSPLPQQALSQKVLAEKNIADKITIPPAAIAAGLQHCRLAAHFETLRVSPLVQVDVAHNPQAVEALAALLNEPLPVTQADAATGRGKTCAIIAMLADKDIARVVECLKPCIDIWCLAGLPQVPRGLSVEALRKRVQNSLSGVKLQSAETVTQACMQMHQQLNKNDRLIIFGSFYTAAQAIHFYASFED